MHFPIPQYSQFHSFQCLQPLGLQKYSGTNTNNAPVFVKYQFSWIQISLYIYMLYLHLTYVNDVDSYVWFTKTGALLVQ